VRRALNPRRSTLREIVALTPTLQWLLPQILP
jgi:hypothetical protein